MTDAQLPQVLRSDETFQQLVSEHLALDQQIHHLSSLAYLTERQQYEETALKKRKLALKDRIEAMVRGVHPAGTSSMRLQ